MVCGIYRFPFTVVAQQYTGQDKAPVNFGRIAREPWNTALIIKIPTASTPGISEKWDASHVNTKDEDTFYTTLIPYHSIAKHMVWKRMLGLVQKYVVVELPLV